MQGAGTKRNMCESSNPKNRASRKTKTVIAAGGDGHGRWPGFHDYTCSNEVCVLSRFEKFSMASSPDPCCPICGRRVPEHVPEPDDGAGRVAATEAN